MIHPSAIVDQKAKLAADVKVGPWSFIGPEVEIASGTEVMSHVVIKGPTKIGKQNKIYQFATVGEDCQDKKYAGEPTKLEIGDQNIIREGCTIHRGTMQDQGITQIGSHNLLMAYAHVAHDCVLGDDIIMANNAILAGHVEVNNGAILGGSVGVHQFCKIGAYSMCAGGAIVFKDVPAYITVGGNPAAPHGLNLEGMKRKNYSKDLMQTLRRAYKVIYRSGLNLQDALTELEPIAVDISEVKLFTDSIIASTRGIVR